MMWKYNKLKMTSQCPECNSENTSARVNRIYDDIVVLDNQCYDCNCEFEITCIMILSEVVEGEDIEIPF